MIILGELHEYNKEPIDYIVENSNYCYCTNESTYEYFKQSDVVVDYAYLPQNGLEYVDNTGKPIGDYYLVIPDSDKYEMYIELFKKKYKIYLV